MVIKKEKPVNNVRSAVVSYLGAKMGLKNKKRATLVLRIVTFTGAASVLCASL
jgi:hypothetical protein